MATARFTGAEADVEQQFEDTTGEDTQDSQNWPDVETLKLPHKGIQVSLKVRQVTYPSRLRKEVKHLLKKPSQHHYPQTHNQVPARMTPKPQSQ